MSLLSIKGQLVDWHCHNVMPDYLAALERHDALLDDPETVVLIDVWRDRQAIDDHHD